MNSVIRHPSSVIAPGSTIGILGSGQLGKMLAIAAVEMGYHCHIYSPEMDAPAYEAAKSFTVSSYTNPEALERFAQKVDIITYEFENVDTSALATIPSSHKIFPSVQVLKTAQHRLREKEAVAGLGIATAPYAPVRSLDDLRAATQKLGYPCILKTCTMGYDGKGQWKIESQEDIESICHPYQAKRTEGSLRSLDFARDDNEYILEGFVDFEMEISVIVARSASGEVRCYPPVQNTHKNHILHETIAPAPISPELSGKAESMARTIAEGLQLVGLMAVEMFVTKAGDILVNELAPRPHNSGHWTLDACMTSQFEQTIRAICGLPLGDTSRLCDARMLNLIGDDVNEWQKYAAMPNAKLHLYGKKESRPGRKMGHVNFLKP
ncbi:MAG: 5-(carboxyamino)imidazole ribonucleotide synthase [Alphaproteobacteria bacterium]|nr:5-(carboxyamino)imidazole ribonucleotide synthase [Alphaproteobacteria bacterium]